MSRSTPGPGDVCHGCNRLLCRCQPEPDVDAHHEASYRAGYEACIADGYSERPMTEWIYRTGSRTAWDAEAKRLRPHMTPLRFAEITWRHHHASAWAYARWFERLYGFDLEGYLAGYDDAGAGLPPDRVRGRLSAVCDERAGARAETALDLYEPIPDIESIPSPPEPVGADDGMPF